MVSSVVLEPIPEPMQMGKELCSNSLCNNRDGQGNGKSRNLQTAESCVECPFISNTSGCFFFFFLCLLSPGQIRDKIRFD